MHSYQYLLLAFAHPHLQAGAGRLPCSMVGEVEMARESYAVAYVTAVCATTLLFDYCLTVVDEVGTAFVVIWPTAFSIPKALFLVDRYVVLPMLVFNGIEIIYPLVCVFYLRWLSVCIAVTHATVEGILLARVLALFGISIMIALTINDYVGEAVNIVENINIMPGCYAASVPSLLAGYWVASTVVESTFFALVAWRVVIWSRDRAGVPPALVLIARDSTIYFATMFVLLFVNLFVFEYAPPFLSSLFVTPVNTAGCIGAGRMLMNLRRFGEREVTESEMGHDYEMDTGSQLTFGSVAFGAEAGAVTEVTTAGWDKNGEVELPAMARSMPSWASMESVALPVTTTMASMEDELPPIEPLSEPWQPNPDPSTIEVPGLDTTAPVLDQIEQIEQLITIRLQNIDANFARAHQILSTKILPNVKRFAVNTEPVREAARFWVSFYEQAAQVRIPTTEDFSADDEQHSAHSEEETYSKPSEEVPSQSRAFYPNASPSESSFAPEDALVSSTPMTMARPKSRAQQEPSMSWAASIESPLERLDKGLKSLSEQDDSVIDYTGQSSIAPESVQPSALSSRSSILTAQDKGKGKQQHQPPRLLQDVLSKNLRAAEKDTSNTATSTRHISPLKVKSKTPKKRNPYVASDARRGDWDGIIDLSKPAAPRDGSSSSGFSTDEDDRPTPNMSPPASSMRFTNRLGRTPVREAAARIGRDLIGDVERLRHGYSVDSEQNLSSSPSTPVLSVHSKRALGIESTEESASPSSTVSPSPLPNASASATSEEPSIESMMRHFGLDVHKYAEGMAQVMGPPQSQMKDSFDDDSFDDAPGPVFVGL
ncbi:hypothetical protein EW145_g5558, partial [Phellinidium pouzarii]